MKILILISILLFVNFSTLHAQELSIHGFVQGNYSVRVTGKELPGSEGGDFLLGEERIQLELTHEAEDQTRMFTKIDFFQDAITNESDMELREAYLYFGKVNTCAYPYGRYGY